MGKYLVHHYISGRITNVLLKNTYIVMKIFQILIEEVVT